VSPPSGGPGAGRAEAVAPVRNSPSGAKLLRVDLFGASLVHANLSAQALLQALLVFRLLPHGFRNHDLRGLLGKPADHISAGQAKTLGLLAGGSGVAVSPSG
jgi:hypothetical protein